MSIADIKPILGRSSLRRLPPITARLIPDASLKRLVMSSAKCIPSTSRASFPRGGLTLIAPGSLSARYFMLLFALSVARLNSPAHDGIFDGAVAPSTARLWTSAKHRLALAVPSLVPRQRDPCYAGVKPWARQAAR